MRKIIIKQIPVGPFQVLTYIVACPQSCDAVIIDSAGDEDNLLALIETRSLRVKYILNTHGHADHVLGNSKLKNLLKIPVCMHEVDNRFLSKDDIFMSTFAKLKIEAVKTYGDFGAWVFDEWKKLNETFFYGENIIGEISWGSTPQDRSLGYYSPEKNLIVLHKTLMRPVYPTSDLKWKLRHLNKKKVRDVLLHEMIHQRVHQIGGWEGENSHNNERFVNEVNRIAKLLDIDIKTKVIQWETIHGNTTPCVELGCLNLKELSNFPYSSRSHNYYYGQS